MVLTYIGGFRAIMDEQNMQDFDGLARRCSRMNFFQRVGADIHEVRLSTTSDGPFNFIAGLYSFDVDYEQVWDVLTHWTSTTS